MWRSLIVSLALATLAACNQPAEPPASAITPTPAEATLIGYAASDFRDHVAPAGANFQNVRSGSLSGEDGVVRALICGEFRASDSAAWTTFATIQTDPYENWLGGGANAYCTSAGTTLDITRDLSAALSQSYNAGG